MGRDGRQPVAHLGDLRDREEQHALADLHRRLRAHRATCACAASRRARPAGSRATGRCSAATRSSTPRSSRPRRSTARRARFRRIRRATARRSGRRTTSPPSGRRHRPRLHVGPVRVEQQRGQGPRLLPLGRDGRVSDSRKYDIQLNVFNLTNRLNYDALIPSDRGRSVPGTDLQALLTFTYKFLLSPGRRTRPC